MSTSLRYFDTARTTYFFTEISFAAMIRLRRRIVDKANHEILSNWLTRGN